MKTDVYKVSLERKGIYHARFFFVGSIPTQQDLLSAIDRREGGSLSSEDQYDAYCSREIVEHVGIPKEVGVLDGETWNILGIEIGKVTIEALEAWTLEIL
jgi:hypothetical protein